MANNFGNNHPAQSNSSRRIAIAALAFFLVLAGVAAMILVPKLNGPKERNNNRSAKPIFLDAEPQVPMVNVLIPVREIGAGEPLLHELFRVQRVTEDKAPIRAVRSLGEIDGLFAKAQVAAEEPLLIDMVTRNRPNSQLTASIPEGYRAVTIRVDERTGVEGWARPGARVDVVWATEVRGEKAVAVIVQGAKVLSAERTTDVGPGTQSTTEKGEPKVAAPVPATVTLLVTADESAKIQLASTSGSLSLSLRGDGDAGNTSASAITLSELIPANKQGDSNNDFEARVKLPKKGGGYEELVLRKGKLVPAED